MKQKKLSFRYLMLLIAMLFSIPASAYNFEVGAVYYTINSTNKPTCSVTSGENLYEGSVVIPSTVTYGGKTYTVTSIGKNAFSGCSELTNVSIPNSVTEICTYAFNGCYGLKSLSIPNSVTNIENRAFYGCI